MSNPGEAATWGTLEELLLACAVNRYGTKCWDSVAGEIQKRSSTNFLSVITPNTCRSKYNDLKRRFSALNTEAAQAPPSSDTTTTTAADSFESNLASLWLEELRRLRIAELKRDLERYDESILSLQQKVKRLKEERQREKNDGGLDLPRIDREKEEEEEEKKKNRIEENKEKPEIPSLSPESGPAEPLGGEGKKSVNAGDAEVGKPGVEMEKVTVEQVADPVGRQKVVPTGEHSCNGSTDSLAAAGTAKESPGSQDRDLGKANDSVGVVGSAGGGEDEHKVAKESSDVQSSASLSRKKGRGEVDAGNNGSAQSGDAGGDEPDGTPAGGSMDKKSRPLIEFLDAARSVEVGSVFVHRLKSQETPRYKNMIRQHIDLASIRAKVEGGQYSDDYPALFYHDLLLLTVNATTFFPKGSSEYKAAIKLRRLISRFSKSLTDSTPTYFNSIQEVAATLKEESLKTLTIAGQPESRSSSSCSESQLSLKQPSSSAARSVIACRKRSSIAAKSNEKKRDHPLIISSSSPPAGVKSLGNEKGKGKGKGVEVVVAAPPRIIKSSSSSFNAVMTKKRSRDQRFSSSARSAAANNMKTSAASSVAHDRVGGGSESATKDSEPKQEKKSSGGGNIDNKTKKAAAAAGSSESGGKKNSVASFLNRMKRSSGEERKESSTLFNSLKIGSIVKEKNTSNSTATTIPSSSNRGGGEQNKKKNGDKSGQVRASAGSSGPTMTKVYTARKGMAQQALKEKEEKEREKEKEKKRREEEEEEEDDEEEEITRRPPKRAAALAAVGKRRRAGRGGGDGESTTPSKKRSRNK